MAANPRRLNLYVDGFNLYYGSLKGTRDKWLDLHRLATRIFPKEQVNRIRYFSARVSGNRDAGAPARQESYLRALRTVPNLSIHLGTFLSNDKSMPLAPAPPTGPEPGLFYLRRTGKKYAWVTKTEEKGSDVNLATQLIVDGFEKDWEMAVIISNDSDLVEPVRIARARFGVVGILCPHRTPSVELGSVASWQRPLYRSYLKHAQFPPVLTDAHGTFAKPADW